MAAPPPQISLARLAVGLLPAVVVLGILFRWSLNTRKAAWALGRMLLQLLLIGYALGFIFEKEHPAVVGGVLSVMLCMASWIAIGSIEKQRTTKLFTQTLSAIALGSLTTLLLVTQGVLAVDPWFSPRTVITLAGMILANSMNSVSIAAERYFSECANGNDHPTARATAMNATMIPVINSLLAVGIVKLPGMMTGQILSGVDPKITARYQIVVMCMLFGSSGIAAAFFLWQQTPKPPQGEGKAAAES